MDNETAEQAEQNNDSMPISAAESSALEAIKSQLRKKLGGELISGLKCEITRLEPLWSKGYMCTIPGDETHNIDAIKEQCGGGYYQLEYRTEEGQYVMRRRIAIEGPPKQDGYALIHPEQEKRLAELEAQQEKAQLARGNESAQIFASVMQMMTAQQAAMAKQMQDSFQQNMIIMREMMATKEQPKIQPQPDPVKQMADYFNLFQDLRGAENSDTSELGGLMEKFIDVLGNRAKAEEKEPPMIGQHYLESTGVQVASVPSKTVHAGESTDDLKNRLLELEAEEVAMIMQSAFEEANDEKKQKLMEIFMGGDTIED